MLAKRTMDEPTHTHEIRSFRLTDATREELIAAFVPVLEDDESVLFATLYGSAVEGEGERVVRDLDVALYLSESALAQAWRAEGRLGVALEEKARDILGDVVPVDVRTYNEAPLHAQFRALIGRLLLLRDADAFARVVEYVVPRHLDMELLRGQAVQDLLAGRSRA
jgi:predicted nucleotidyltransferase